MKKLLLGAACVLAAAIYSVAQDVPKAEVYAGYTFVRFYPSGVTNAFTANGGIGSFQYNFTSHFSFVAELGGVHNGRLTIGDLGSFSPDQTAFTYLFGPRVFFNKAGVVSPFIEYLVGGFHNSRSFFVPNSLLPVPLPPVSGVTVTPGPNYTKFASTQNAVAMAVGGGVDIRLSRLISFRPVELDYLPTNFSPFNISGIPGTFNNTRWQQNLRYSTGVNFRFGAPNPVPPTAACNVTPQELLPWAGPVNASVQTTNFNPRHDLDFNWTSTSGAVAGNGPTATIDTTNLSPGSYTIDAHVSDPRRSNMNTASCTASFTVRQPQAPQVACTVSPSTVHPGDAVTVNVQASSPDESQLARRTFNTSAGALREGETTRGSQPGSFTTVATLDTTNVTPGPVNINVGVTDVHGLSGSCETTANVIAEPVTVASETLISDCEFNNPRKLARVDNECKAVLDEVALRMQHEPNGKLVVVGCEEEKEDIRVANVGALRAANAKSYLTGGEAKQQIDASRIEIRTNSETCGKRANFYFVPEGGTFTQKDTVVVDESTLPADRSGAVVTRRKKSK